MYFISIITGKSNSDKVVSIPSMNFSTLEEKGKYRRIQLIYSGLENCVKQVQRERVNLISFALYLPFASGVITRGEKYC